MKEQKANPQKEKPVTKFCLAKQMAKQTGGRDHAQASVPQEQNTMPMQRGWHVAEEPHLLLLLKK